MRWVDPDPSTIADPYVAALIRAIQAAPSRTDPIAALADSVPLPNEIALLVGASAWHDASIAIGEMWFTRPTRVTAKHLRGSSKEALQLGILASGEAVIARLSKTTCTVVEVGGGEPERRRGSLAVFVRHCVAWAREHDRPTPLDPFLER